MKKDEEAKKDLNFPPEKAGTGSNTLPNQSNDSWRFFDPLASPSGDEEMLKMEAILEEKAKKANQGFMIQGLLKTLKLANTN